MTDLAACPCHDDRPAVERLLDPMVPDHRIQDLLVQADALSRKLGQGRGQVWAAIGVDNTPCPMGCSFCSHAARWQASGEEIRLEPSQIVEAAGRAADDGADFIVLRTTQFYGLDRLASLGRAVRSRIGDGIRLVVNTGECRSDEVKALLDAGYTTAYHVVRLRENTDTTHTVEMRLRSLDAIRLAGMELMYLIEPLGPEHQPDEILIEARRARSLGAIGTGVMARISVMGTPLARLGQVGEAYLRRVAAAARLEYPDGGPFLCVHPPTLSSLTCGCNTVVVEQGANPRASSGSAAAWQGFDMTSARAALQAAGLTVRPARQDGLFHRLKSGLGRAVRPTHAP